jgi:glucans biosynthesis protein
VNGSNLKRCLAAGFVALLAVGPAVHAQNFGFSDVVAKAKALAKKSWQPPKQIPDFLKNLKYDQYRDIRFRVKDSLWKQSNTKFQVRLIHPGLYYKHAVKINVVDASGVHQVKFSPNLFDYGHNHFKNKIPANLGFAGFKLTYPLTGPHSHNQFISFAGASYFRAVGKGEAWGLSARGLAVDTGLKSGEEFPFFKTFWLVRPAPNAKQVKVYALLDSKRVTGAYRFIVSPGKAAVIGVKATLFERAHIKQLGIAPLTSMFFYGENSPRPKGYWRPEVHDSDGLLIHANTGEWLWRPLVNPPGLLVSAFQLKSPKGFGLMQRDRRFHDYEDLGARYDLRPSGWVTPHGDWGPGQVMLVEIPSKKEVNDNIVAFWVPKQVPKPGQPIKLAYTLRFTSRTPQPAAIGQNVSTWLGDGDKSAYRRFVLEFESAALSNLSAKADVEGVITVGDGGKLIHQHVEKNPVTGGWRLAFQVDPPDKPLELRAFLKEDGKTLTETWSFLLPPS